MPLHPLAQKQGRLVNVMDDQGDRDMPPQTAPMRRICVYVPENVYLIAAALKARTRKPLNKQVAEGLLLLAKSHDLVRSPK
jgi:hypothetical protein